MCGSRDRSDDRTSYLIRQKKNLNSSARASFQPRISVVEGVFEKWKHESIVNAHIYVCVYVNCPLLLYLLIKLDISRCNEQRRTALTQLALTFMTGQTNIFSVLIGPLDTSKRCRYYLYFLFRMLYLKRILNLPCELERDNNIFFLV